MEDQEYISKKITPLIEQLIRDILLSSPANLEHYCLSWLKRRTLSASEHHEISSLRTAVHRIKNGQSSSDSSESSEEQDSTEDELSFPNRRPSKFQRASVSAEAFGSWNQPIAFTAKVFAKSEEQIEKILQRLEASLIFSSINAEQRRIIADAMVPVEFEAGMMVITQGEDGNHLYVVESGKLECFKVINGENTFLKVYETGEAFGELALLYNCPRAASIRTVEGSKLWALDRETFVHIVKKSVEERRRRFEDVLGKVPLLGCMGRYEKDQLADALQEAEFLSGEVVIREGEWGDVFYLIESGTADVIKTVNPGCPPVKVLSYDPGDYFGELALLKGEPRAASVIATSLLKCLTVDRKSFKRLLGDLENIMKNNSKKYEGYNPGE